MCGFDSFRAHHFFNGLAASTDPLPTDCVHFVSTIALVDSQRARFRRCLGADTSWLWLLRRGPSPSSLQTGSSWHGTFPFRTRDEHSTEPGHSGRPASFRASWNCLATVMRWPHFARFDGKTQPFFRLKYRTRSAWRTRGLIGKCLRPFGVLLS